MGTDLITPKNDKKNHSGITFSLVFNASATTKDSS